MKYCSDTIERCGLEKCKLFGCILNNQIKIETSESEQYHRQETESTFRPHVDLNTVATKVRKGKSLNILEKSYLNWLNTK